MAVNFFLFLKGGASLYGGKTTINTCNMRKDHNEYIRTVGEMRGIVLNQFIVLEWLIEKFIAGHFFSSQKLRDEFLKEFIYGTRMSFSKKVQFFKNLVKSKDNIKYENISNKFSEFEKEIGVYHRQETYLLTHQLTMNILINT